MVPLALLFLVLGKVWAEAFLLRPSAPVVFAAVADVGDAVESWAVEIGSWLVQSVDSLWAAVRDFVQQMVVMLHT